MYELIILLKSMCSFSFLHC